MQEHTIHSVLKMHPHWREVLAQESEKHLYRCLVWATRDSNELQSRNKKGKYEYFDQIRQELVAFLQQQAIPIDEICEGFPAVIAILTSKQIIELDNQPLIAEITPYGTYTPSNHNELPSLNL